MGLFGLGDKKNAPTAKEKTELMDEELFPAQAGVEPTALVPPPTDEAGSPRTQLLWGSGRGVEIPTQPTQPKVGGPDNPIVGWLVVVTGTGRGHALPLGYGMNEIGRHPEQRVPLVFGDLGISEHRHAILTYDPRGRKYYLQHGESKNLTYLNGQPVLIPTELHGDEHIELGQTTLRFMPLCGQDFDWQDLPPV